MEENILPVSPLADTAIVLVNPKYPENIGATARIGFNFGVGKLIVVGGRNYDLDSMLKMATHKAAHLIHNLEHHEHLSKALAPYHFVVGTTARTGKRRILKETPKAVMEEVVKLMPGHKTALLFGPENTGLTNEELNLCQFFTTIPTAAFSSLNLAQAVAIHCYELYSQAITVSTPVIGPSEYATSFEIENMYGHIDQALTATEIINDTNRTFWIRSIRQFLSRVKLRKKETSIIRTICRKLLYDHSPDIAD